MGKIFQILLIVERANILCYPVHQITDGKTCRMIIYLTDDEIDKVFIQLANSLTTDRDETLTEMRTK